MSKNRLKKVLVGSLATILGLASFASSVGASYFTDYSATASGAEAVAQFNQAGGETIKVGGSFVYTYLQVGLSFVEANAIGLIVISLFLLLIAVIAYRRRMSKLKSQSL